MKLKQVIIIRKDVKINAGKIVSQGSHASLGAFLKTDIKTREVWLKESAKKVVLKVSTLDRLKEIYKKVKKENIPCFLVKDAGLTQLEPGTITALGIGPVEEGKIDKITGKLKLL